MKDNAFLGILFVLSIGLNIVFGVVLSDCPPKQEREQEAANVEMEMETLRRRLDRSIDALRNAGIPVNEVLAEH